MIDDMIVCVDEDDHVESFDDIVEDIERRLGMIDVSLTLLESVLRRPNVCNTDRKYKLRRKTDYA